MTEVYLNATVSSPQGLCLCLCVTDQVGLLSYCQICIINDKLVTVAVLKQDDYSTGVFYIG